MDLALITSLLSFVIAVVALIWQIVKHVLDGGRVKVYLNTAIWQPGSRININRSGRFTLPNDQVAQTVVYGRALELAQLVVENPGRLPVTIHSPGLAFSGHGTKHHSVVPRMFGTDAVHGLNEAITDTVVRIEPYARATFLLDYWSVMPGILGDAPDGQVFVRGYVGVAGKANRPRESVRRLRWKINRDRYTAIEGSPDFTPYGVLWRVLYRHLQEHGNADGDHDAGRRVSRESVGYLLEETMPRFGQRPELEQLADALTGAAEKLGEQLLGFRLALRNAYEELDRMNGHLTEWAEGLSVAQREKKEPASAKGDLDQTDESSPKTTSEGT